MLIYLKYFSSIIERGESNSMAQISVKISDEEREMYTNYCKEHDIKISQLVRWAIKAYILKDETKETKENKDK